MVHDEVVVRSYCSTTLFHFDASDANAICTTGVSETFHRLEMRTSYGEATNTRRVEKNVKNLYASAQEGHQATTIYYRRTYFSE
jgi:hypothetical protein